MEWLFELVAGLVEAVGSFLVLETGSGRSNRNLARSKPPSEGNISR
jgi:hypothetical protein